MTPTWNVIEADCVQAMRAMPEASVDAVVCDPPYGLEFMGKDWDRPWAVGFSATGYTDGGKRPERPSYGSNRNPCCRTCRKHQRGTDSCRCERPDFDETPATSARLFGQWCEIWAREALRVLKPGGHLLAFGGTRTYHRLVCAIEDAGFEIRDSVMWLYGSGFPKSLDVSKAIDKAAGAEREVIGASARHGGGVIGAGLSYELPPEPHMLTASATPAAHAWEGWGTALKPAHEPICVARKSLTGTVAGNVLEHRTGALNIDGCRIDGAPRTTHADGNYTGARDSVGESVKSIWGADSGGGLNVTARGGPPAGRWPSNVCLSHSDGCVSVGTRRVKTGTAVNRNRAEGTMTSWMGTRPSQTGDDQGFADPDGLEEVEAWRCEEGCPVRALDGQSGERRSAYPGSPHRASAYEGTPTAENGVTSIPQNVAGLSYSDQGGASRFFYVAKASSSERNAGLDALAARRVNRYSPKAQGPLPQQTPTEGTIERNVHPTVKPVELMRWLVRLVTPPRGTILDPFTGSGTTGIAAVLEGFRFIGVEREAEYRAIAEARIRWWAEHPDGMTLVRRLEAEAERRAVAESGQLDLLGEFPFSVAHTEKTREEA